MVSSHITERQVFEVIGDEWGRGDVRRREDEGETVSESSGAPDRDDRSRTFVHYTVGGAWGYVLPHPVTPVVLVHLGSSTTSGGR